MSLTGKDIIERNIILVSMVYINSVIIVYKKARIVKGYIKISIA